LIQTVFRVGDEHYDWADAVISWVIRGLWADVEVDLMAGLACEARLARESGETFARQLEEQASEFRYERGLLSADETLAWLARYGLDRDSWERALLRSLLRRHWSEQLEGEDEPIPISEPEFWRELWPESICSGALARACRELADRAAIAASAGGSVADEKADDATRLACAEALAHTEALASWLPPDLAARTEQAVCLEHGYQRERQVEAEERVLGATLVRQHLDWIRIRGRSLLFEREGEAREALLRLREDADEIGTVARDAGVAEKSVDFLLDQIHPALRSQFTSAEAGEVVGPLPIFDAFGVYQIAAKELPALSDPEIRQRAVDRTWRDRVGHEVDERVRWEIAL